MSKVIKKTSLSKPVIWLYVIISGLVTGFIVQIRWYYFHEGNVWNSIISNKDFAIIRMTLSPLAFAFAFVIIYRFLICFLKGKNNEKNIQNAGKTFLLFNLLLLWGIFMYDYLYLYFIIAIFIICLFTQISFFKNKIIHYIRIIYYFLKSLFIKVSNTRFFQSIKNNNFLIAMLVALIAIWWIFKYHFGFLILNPENISWLMNNDWAQHFLGWHFYRNSPLEYPLGKIYNLFYPLGTSIGYTDSIPLLAIPFKIINNLLPPVFQYIGIWFLICFILQAVFATLLLQEFKLKLLPLITGILFFLFSPVLLVRFPHPALCAQWLILACFWLWFYSNKQQFKKKKIILIQLLLLFISSLIHPYLCVMIIVFTIALFWKIMINGTKKGFINFLSLFIISLLIVIFNWYSISYLDSSPNNVISDWGYGHFSANLISFINPGDLSFFLKKIPLYSEGQILEGFAYLGIGIILICIIMLFMKIASLYHSSIKTTINKNSIKRNIILISIIFLFFLFSLSNIITIGKNVILTIPLSPGIKSFFSIFRSTGRFIWPLYYFIFLTVIVLLGRGNLFSQKISNIILVSCLLLQLLDIKPLTRNFHFTKETYENYANFNFKKWSTLYSNIEYIMFYPPFYSEYLQKDDYIPFSYLAANMHKKINVGYIVRTDPKKKEKEIAKFEKMINTGDFPANTLIVTNSDHIGRFYENIINQKIGFANLDGYYVGLSKNNPIYTEQWRPGIFDHISYFNKYNDKVIFLSVKDEATSKMSPDFKEYLINLGSKIDSLQYRGSWLAVIYKGKFLYEQISNKNYVEISLKAGDVLNGIYFPKDVFLHSAGNDFGNKSIIKIDNTDFSFKMRGINVAVTDERLDIVDAINFDTYRGTLGINYMFY